jgi:hypothetical protein
VLTLFTPERGAEAVEFLEHQLAKATTNAAPTRPT